MIKEKTCSVTGHRILKKDFDLEALKSAFINVINCGYDTFLTGMALGFDTVCFNTLNKLKSDYDIKIIACLPCADQDKFFNAKQKKEYLSCLEKADEIITLNQAYYEGCMHQRNKYLVDNSSLVIAYLNYNRGGTYQTVKYAVESGVKVLYFGK